MVKKQSYRIPLTSKGKHIVNIIIIIVIVRVKVIIMIAWDFCCIWNNQGWN